MIRKVKMGLMLLLVFGLIQPAGVLAQASPPKTGVLQNHAPFNELLDKYVNEAGLVNYQDLCQDKRLDSYTDYLSRLNWKGLSQDDQLAFWINAYNAFTLKAICEEYPVKSINDLHGGGLVLGTVFKTTIWDKDFFTVNGQAMSLGYIEHEILRKGPEKARIHFAIVCAAVSCPPLRQEAYEGYKIDQQLDDQAKTFLKRTDLNQFDSNRKVAHLSGIFKWFLKDFGKNKEDLLRYLSQYAPTSEIADSLKNSTDKWRVRWKKYDWSLNQIGQ